MFTIKDQLSRVVSFSETPKRIISLVPSQTELLFDLGLKDNLVGVTKFCVHPREIRKEKIIVGGTKTVHFDKITNLKPDLIICNKEENTEEIVEQAAKISPVYISDIITLKDNLKFIRDIGIIFNIENRAIKLVNKIQVKLDSFKSIIAEKPQQRVAYFIWKDPWMVAGRNTFINELLKLNRFKNIFSDKSRYPKIDLLELENYNLDLILLSSEPYPFKEKHLEEIQKYTDTKVLFVNGEYFSWYGSRLLKAFDYFKTLH